MQRWSVTACSCLSARKHDVTRQVSETKSNGVQRTQHSPLCVRAREEALLWSLCILHCALPKLRNGCLVRLARGDLSAVHRTSTCELCPTTYVKCFEKFSSWHPVPRLSDYMYIQMYKIADQGRPGRTPGPTTVDGRTAVDRTTRWRSVGCLDLLHFIHFCLSLTAALCNILQSRTTAQTVCSRPPSAPPAYQTVLHTHDDTAQSSKGQAARPK